MLPLRGFKWVPDEIDILNVPEDSNLGFILEVDLEYPKELHDKYNLYPLAPEGTIDMLSPRQENIPLICGSAETRSKSSQQEEVCSALPESSIVC